MSTDFTPQPATRWLRPGLLLHVSKRAVVSALLGEYNDKRELMGTIRADGHLDLSGPGELWFDYVADTGDGYPATHAVASLLARPALEVALRDGSGAVALPRGRLLVMGGDECYPAASVDSYEDRLIGPYRAALPEVPGEAPYLQAVPGNHDWYDGLTAFMRTFCQGRWIGGWRSRQARSYFATKLSDGWWLWGIDIQFDTYLDEAQLTYFRALAEHLGEGDAVVLCSAKPSWVSATDQDPEAYATLDFFERTVIRPRGATVRLALSGDRHHYARYAAADGAQKVTAGGGGAYLSATHHLPERLLVPPPDSTARGRSAPVPYWREARYPAAGDSRRLGLGILRLPFSTPTFAALLGTVYVLLALAVGAALGVPAHGLAAGWRAMSAALHRASYPDLAGGLIAGLPALVLALVVVLAAVAFTKRRTPRGWAAGTLHGLAHLALALGVVAAAAALTGPLPGSPGLLAMLALVFAAGGLLAAELVAVYLLAADLLGINTNELFAAQAIPHRKNFLRLCLRPDGTLTLYPIGIPRVPGHQKPFLIEEPIEIQRTPMREIPLYTVDGVPDAEVRTYPFATEDGLGLSLLRFSRGARATSSVLVIHGLTTSSDMFIMPEHENLVTYLLDHGYSDVWTLDFRMSNRYSYNLFKHRSTMDDIALYDFPPAVELVRRHNGGNPIHVICHCLGSVSFLMSLFGGAVDGIASVIANSVGLTPRAPAWSRVKLRFAPFLVETLIGLPYLNPRWSEDPGWSRGKLFSRAVSLFHRECDVPACHMLSLMWGTGWPALYSHGKLADITHRRGGDLYGATSMHYYRHVRRMVAAGHAVKMTPTDPRYDSLPDNYLSRVPEVDTPVLLVTGDRNNVFRDSNIVCHREFERLAPGRHELAILPGYGHQDPFMGEHVATEVFPTFLDFLDRHR